MTRRPVAVREKGVHYMSTEWIDDHHFRLVLKTMAGTYPFIVDKIIAILSIHNNWMI